MSISTAVSAARLHKTMAGPGCSRAATSGEGEQTCACPSLTFSCVPNRALLLSCIHGAGHCALGFLCNSLAWADQQHHLLEGLGSCKRLAERGCAAQVYYVYGFMLLVFLILVVVTSCVTIVGTYFLLNAENYHWQWTALASAASTALCAAPPETRVALVMRTRGWF